MRDLASKSNSLLSTLLLLGSLTAACSKNVATQSDPRGAATTSERDPCEPASLGLGNATALPPFRLPQGCSATNASAGATPTIVRSEEEYRAHVTCNGGAVPPSGIDFAKHDLALAARTLSPAGAGFGAVDDGSKVTTIARQQFPCSSEPPMMPMPMPYTQAYLLPSHAVRTFGELACTIPKKCR